MDTQICLIGNSRRTATDQMISELKLTTALRGITSYMADVFFTPPFKIANVSASRNSECLHLILMSASPGMLDGDHYRMYIHTGPGTSLKLQTQAYQRLYTMQQGASQHMEIQMDNGSTLHFIPHPLVPQKQAHYTAVNRINLTENCRLYWGEIVTCGRKLNGEIFHFTRLHIRTEIRYRQKLVLLDNLLLEPAIMDLSAVGCLEGYTHQGTFLLFDTHTGTDLPALADNIYNILESSAGITAGISLTAGPGIVVRLLAQGAELLYDQMQQIAALTQQHITQQTS
ncbi:urease accessory protein UreD [Chitinophaga pendula]|uniref:urease accessory protein UreD n=1 Tax=Chitinophaga TaxID=79328 RepID=UPI000BAF2165|nr:MULTISPECIES: urease accessory protein UreD [Chitinophaga]ASZ13108.1 urease accessory protein [Chitinophaga sp. MD30]UCJ09268.1 urease accessory protein UreD [Chitinophaga pendula]